MQPNRRIAIVGAPKTANVELVDGLSRTGCDAVLVDPDSAAALGPGDVALVRLDVLPTLDGVEPGLDRLAGLELEGVRLLNRPEAMLRAHDKLLTARVLERAGVPHPRTAHLIDADAPLPLEPPLVLKPRFGSWGADVFRAETVTEARRLLREVRDRAWFRAQGVLVQELVPAEPRDVRALVAARRVVGAVERLAAWDEWRTNVSLGGARAAVVPTAAHEALARVAVAATGLDLVGVDLLEGPDGLVVVELNGAVDFDAAYSLPGRDVYRDIADALGLAQLQPA